MAKQITGSRLPSNHPCSLAFLDESGAILHDRFFAIGLLKTAYSPELLRATKKLRDRQGWYGEMKFSGVTAATLSFCQEVADVWLEAGLAEFRCYVADRAVADPVARFGSSWDAYGGLAEQVIRASVRSLELVTVLADEYSTPDHVRFEESVRAAVNDRLRRLAVVSICRADSRSSDGLQVADLLTSAVAFEFRINARHGTSKSPKAQLAAHVRELLGADSFLDGWRNKSHSVAIYGRNAARSVST